MLRKKKLKTPEQIDLMRQAGLVVWHAHQAAAERIEPGATTAEIDEAVEKTIVGMGGIPLFKGVPGKVPFPAATCISVNEEVVHGIPGTRQLKEGDVVSVDIGVRLDGWCGDAAVTHPVGAIEPKVQQLLDVTEGVLRLAIEKLHTANRWSQVSKAMQQYVNDAGFKTVEALVGHCIGREMWEPPQVPNYYSRMLPDFKLRTGMVMAIEPMINMLSKEVRLMPDHWTFTTKDNLPSAHFEHTIALTEDGPVALTAGPDGEGWSL